MSAEEWGAMLYAPQTESEPAPTSALDMRRARGTADAHNGVPEVRPYIHRPGEKERDADVARRLEAIRNQLANGNAERCPTCAYVICGCGWSS